MIDPPANRPIFTAERLGDGDTLFCVRTPLATATISLFGGQVLSWMPTHAGEQVLWMSPLAALDGTKAIRGGAPVCWPWFGAHPTSKGLPAHGLARLSHWRIDRMGVLTDGTAELVLSLARIEAPSGATEQEIAGGLRLSQTLRIGATLSISLTTVNEAHIERRYTEGLHTYFHVDDLRDVQVTGLDGCSYADLTAGNARCVQSGAIEFHGETGRLFVGTEHACEIVDRRLGRRILIEKSGSRSTAVWNPGAEVASRMADLGPTAWQQMVCVETANALDDASVLAPGEQRTMTARFSVETLV